MLRNLKLVCTVALSLKQIVCVCSLSIVFNDRKQQNTIFSQHYLHRGIKKMS